MTRPAEKRPPGPCQFCGRTYRMPLRRHLRRACDENQLDDRVHAICERLRDVTSVRRRPSMVLGGSVRWRLWARDWTVRIAEKVDVPAAWRVTMLRRAGADPELRYAILSVLELGRSTRAMEMVGWVGKSEGQEVIRGV